jgi:undecaprenyl-diphosphatase
VGLPEAVLLGVVQGAAEFLPISSDGHLVLARALLGIGPVPVLFDVLLHAGTLLVVLAYFRADLARLVADRDAAYIGRIVVAGAATFAVAWPLKTTMEAAFESTRAAGVGLLATAAVLAATAGRIGDRRTVAPLDALVIGLVQGLAPFPGVSRSGLTIAAAILLGIDRAEAFRFSFLLSIPVVAGAVVLKAVEGGPIGAPPAAVAAAVATAAATGAAALPLLARVVGRSFHRFAWYCAPVGLLALVL